MRMMLKVKVPAAKGNDSLKDASMQKAIQETMERARPEAAYFTMQEGQRCAYFFFEMDDVTDLPSITEPMWMGFEADVGLVPAMNAEDLQAGLQKLG